MENALSIAIEVTGGYQGGAEPWRKAISIRVDRSGFHDTHFVGYGGDDRLLLDVSSLADMLLKEFDGTSLLNLLGHVVRLQAAIEEQASLSSGA